MNSNAWAKTWPKYTNAVLTKLAFLFVGIPLAISIIALLLLPERSTTSTYQKLESAQRWVEALPVGTKFNYDGLVEVSKNHPDLSGVQWTPVTLPEVVALPVEQAKTDVEPMTRAWFRFTVTVPDQITPAEPYALYGTRVMASAYSVWIDGQPVYADLDEWRIQWNYPLFVQIPFSQMKPGQTINIDLAVPHQTNQGYALGSMYFGKSSELKYLINERRYLQITLPVVGMFLVGVMGMFSVLMWRKRPKEHEHFWLALTAVFVVVCNLQFIYDFSYNDTWSAWYGSLVDASSSWIFLTFFIFALRFNKLDYPKAENLLIVITVVNTLLTLPLWGWQVNALRLQIYIMMAAYVQVAAIFTWLALTRRTLEHILFCLGVWTLLITGIHDVTYLTSRAEPDQIFWFPYGAFMLFFLAEYLLQSRYVMALGQVEKNNQTLAEKLAEREKEILAQQTLLIQAEKDRVKLSERARLSQDIHDGIGSALTGTLIGLRNNTTTTDQAAQSVRECIDDIRIVMESLEPSANDLSTLLGTLKQRFADRLQSSGLQIHWDIADLPVLPWLDAPQALDILRALQEIITNTLKHAKASHMYLSAGIAHEMNQPDSVFIRIKDDGQGFDTALQTQGRGMSNIHNRLARIGAQITLISHAGQGTQYNIHLRLAVK
jgi:signal transduction histidine kinase